MSNDLQKRFQSIITETLKYREENHIVKNDFLSIISKLKYTKGEYEFTDVDVAAHSVGFFFDGFETSSITLSFTLYELAANVWAQEKLREEINAVLLKYNGDLTYEAVQEMSYLDNVYNGTFQNIF